MVNPPMDVSAIEKPAQLEFHRISRLEMKGFAPLKFKLLIAAHWGAAKQADVVYISAAH
ncbi:hypothetical protein PFLUOLIPICF7_23820 [Pseudomonas simiae]|jgi:hypothetical protein|nr:hypothetical protein PFLUOLIPICF7_23820 [Pseudomonas simiae]